LPHKLHTSTKRDFVFNKLKNIFADHELVAENLMDSKEMDLAKDIMKNEGLFTQHF